MKNIEPVLRSQKDGVIKAEVYVGKAHQSWRWDITYYRLKRVSDQVMGVEGRVHLDSDFGYARTERGAWRAIRKAFNTYPGVIV